MLILDCETYKDYFLLSFLNTETGNVKHFEMFDGQSLDTDSISRLMRNKLTVSFNGLSFDLPIIVHALEGGTCETIKRLADKIIKSNMPAWKICKDLGIVVPKKWNHIDLIEVAPGQSSLKIYGGRLNCKTIQDLPIEPDASINPIQREQLRLYCENDLQTTFELYKALEKQIKLRESMSEQYGVDLRSKSDAQIAESVIRSELSKMGTQVSKGQSQQTHFYYINPKIVAFKSSYLRSMFERVLNTRFEIGDNGSVLMPDWLKEDTIRIGKGQYQMGIGGLHSCEKSQWVEADDKHILCDMDVASYYPSIILQQRLAPQSMGLDFLKVYQSIVTRRLEAKKKGDDVTANTLKIVVNGSFGKLGSKWSNLYAPDLLIQTTVTGQLCLLMLIERMEDAGVTVVSANTDGIVMHCPKHLESIMEDVAFGWTMDTTYVLERTDYLKLASRDVNNYVAVKLDGKTKGKGCFAGAGLAKNPEMQIVYEAVAKFVGQGASIEQTVIECKDITKFVTIRRVQGGGQWREQFLGKAVRFYWSKDVPQDECIRYAQNSNKVPNSDGARPCMVLPESFPSDVNHEAYILKAKELLGLIGHA